MADKDSSNAPTDNASGLPPDNIEASPAPADVDQNSGPTVADKLPSDTTPGGEPGDSHNVPHPHFKWHAEVLVDGHDVHEGMVKDISMNGLNLILDHNLQNSKLVKLHVHVPPPSSSSPHHVLEISGKITSTVYDSAEESFRSGVVFSEFTLESDRTLLQSLLL